MSSPHCKPRCKVGSHILQDVVESWWGLQFHSYWQTGSDSFIIESESGQKTFVPRTRAAVFCSEDAVILSFRGSEPTNLINLRSAGTWEFWSHPQQKLIMHSTSAYS